MISRPGTLTDPKGGKYIAPDLREVPEVSGGQPRVVRSST